VARDKKTGNESISDMPKTGNKIRIPLPERQALNLLLKVKPGEYGFLPAAASPTRQAMTTAGAMYTFRVVE
jgi:hypothetical protein